MGLYVLPHSHDTGNVGVITQGELILIADGAETRYRAGAEDQLTEGKPSVYVTS